MDHQRIEDGSVVEAYVTDRLGEAERTEFEAHLVDCPQCLDQVEAAQGVAAGLRALTSPAASAKTLPTPRRSSTAVVGWAVAASGAAVLAIGWGVTEQRRLRLVAQAAERRATAGSPRDAPRTPCARPRRVGP
jgi:hypothetical protein